MKIRSMVCSPKFLAVFPLILALLLGVACGGDAATPPPAATAAPTSTPQPTPTPQPTLDFAALAQQFGSQVQRDIASQIAGIEFPEGLTAEDVQAIVAAAISNIPEGLTPEDVQAIVTQAISQIPEGLTAEQMEAAIKNAVDAGVQRAVSEAVAQIPPTATPAPTEPPAAMTLVETRLAAATEMDVESNDPIISNSQNSPQVVHMYEALVGFGFEGELLPMLAESWEVDSTATEWNFKLRKGVPFHRKATDEDDGEFSAEDVKATLLHGTQPELLSSRADLWQVVHDNMRIVNDYEVTFVLDEPQIDFDWLLSQRNELLMLSKAHLDAEGQEGVEASPVGTGPYQFVERASGSYILHVRVPYKHWRVTPDFPQVQIFSVKEVSTRQAMLLAGQIHLTQLTPDLERAAIANGMVTIASNIPQQNPYVIFGGQYYPDKLVGKRTGAFPDLPFSDVYHPATEVPWVNKKVREALNKAVDRKTIIETIFDGKAVLNYNFPFHPALNNGRGWNPEWEERFEEKYGYDPERAKELLKEAEAEIGQPLDWSKVQFRIAIQAEMPQATDLTLAIYNYWKAIGVPVESEAMDDASRGPHHRAASWGGVTIMIDGGFRPEPSFLLIYLNSGRTLRNVCCQFFENEEVDTLYEQLSTEFDLNKRHEILQDIGDVVYNEYGIMGLVSLPIVFTVNPNVVADYQTSGILGIRDLEYVKAVKN